MSGPEQPPGVGTYTTASPILVRAVQLTEDADWDAIATWCGGLIVDDHRGRALVIPDVEPRGILSDWVIQGVTGKYFFRYPEEFAATYRPTGDGQVTPEQDHPDRLAEIKQRLSALPELRDTCTVVTADGETRLIDGACRSCTTAWRQLIETDRFPKFTCEWPPPAGQDIAWLIAEVERLRSECLKLADDWDQQAATHYQDYDRSIGSADDDTRMTARYMQGKSAIYDAAATALRAVLALPAKDGAR